jgi:hypothetical protein
MPFAASPATLDVYARCLVDARRLREADAPEARARLRALLQQQTHSGGAGSPLSGDAVRFAALGGAGGTLNEDGPDNVLWLRAAHGQDLPVCGLPL